MKEKTKKKRTILQTILVTSCCFIESRVYFWFWGFSTTFDKMRNTNGEDVLWFSCLSLSWSHPWEASTSSLLVLLHFSIFTHLLILFFYFFTHLLFLFFSFFFTLVLLLFFFLFQLQILEKPNYSSVSWQLDLDLLSWNTLDLHFQSFRSLGNNFSFRSKV